MWKMQQLVRRAGALDVDLMSINPRRDVVIVFCSGVVLEKIWKLFEGRAAWVALISLLSTGDARGANPFLSVCGICCDERNV